jgi:hypothetical protein
MIFSHHTSNDAKIEATFSSDNTYVIIKFGSDDLIIPKDKAKTLSFELETLFLSDGFEDDVKP